MEWQWTDIVGGLILLMLLLTLGTVAIVQEIQGIRYTNRTARQLRHKQALATIEKFEREEYARSIQLRPRTTIETSPGIWACWVCGRRVSPGFPCGAEHEAIDEAIAEGL